MNKFCALCLAFLALALLFSVNTPQTFAANCSPLYNGGLTNHQYCINPTPTPTNTATAPRQTTGGQRIYPVSKSKTTPNTGPEEWALPALFFIGGMGFWLRNKAKT